MKDYTMNWYRKIWFHYPELALSLLTDFSKSDNGSVYREVLERLLATNKFSFRMIKDLQKPNDANRIIVGLRHDVDIDITTALRLARIEHEVGVQGSYYVLHTAPYYGYYQDGQYHRSTRCVEILLEIQSLGHEVGLHNDCLFNLTKFGLLPEESLHSELEFLRSHGIKIYGTASHGSYHTYLASNYEIFAGMSIEGRQEFTDKNGQTHRIGYVSMKDFGLDYEANFIESSFIISAEEYNRKNMPHFSCPAEESDEIIRDYDAQYGIFGQNLWSVMEFKQSTLYFVDLPRVIQKFLSHQCGDKLVLDSHPIYLGHSLRRRSLYSLAKVAKLLMNKKRVERLFSRSI